MTDTIYADDSAIIQTQLDDAYGIYRPAGSGRYIEVGEGKPYDTILKAAQASADGDTIVVYGGTYAVAGNEYRARYNDEAPLLIQHGLSIIGIGDVVFDIGYVDKGALVTAGACSHLYVENITFQGANNRDFNGAGIRHQAGDLTVVGSLFRNNENGILGGADNSKTTILDSEFDSNGFGDGQSHGIYINRTHGASLRVENSYFHDTKIGHHIKSLAENTIVRRCRLDDGEDGTASMAVDVTAGGDLLIEECTVIQSAKTDNARVFFYSSDRNYGEPGKVIIRDNDITNYFDGGELIGTNLLRLVIDIENNRITDPSKKMAITNAYYNSFGNLLNGQLLAEGTYKELSQVEVPDWLRSLLPAQPARFAHDPEGKFLFGLWGAHELIGTAFGDVLYASSKGLKIMMGGDGNDVYIWDGQQQTIEKADEGWDVVVGGGGWGVNLPENVEVYWNTSSKPMVHLNANDEDNVLIGSGPGENISGKGGDDTLDGGGSGGDTYMGGDGVDLVLFRGHRSDYTFEKAGYSLLVTHPNGEVDTVRSDVEYIAFAKDSGFLPTSYAVNAGAPLQTLPNPGEPLEYIETDPEPEPQPVPDPNQAPIVIDQSVITNEDGPITINVLQGSSDPDGDDISVVRFTASQNGTVSDKGNGRLTYTPNAGFSGRDSFVFTVSDGNLESSAAVTITVLAKPAPPPVVDISLPMDISLEGRVVLHVDREALKSLVETIKKEM
jgi:hypothetical protein